MTPNELARLRERANEEPLVVARVPEGFRVYSPTGRTRPYLVSGIPDEPACTCPDFRAHVDDPDWRCIHILAALRALDPSGVDDEGEGDPFAREERAAIAAESGDGDGSNGRNSIAQMLLKRSVSPDGRIDSLSIEFACPANGESLTTLTARADRILTLQTGIAEAFLRKNGRKAPEPRSSAPVRNPDGSTPAQLLRVGGSDGRFGRRLFLTIATGDRMLRLYGTRNQLAGHVAQAGFPDLSQTIAEGVTLNVPCRIMTAAAGDGGFVRVERVLPAEAPR